MLIEKAKKPVKETKKLQKPKKKDNNWRVVKEFTTPTASAYPDFFNPRSSANFNNIPHFQIPMGMQSGA